LSAPVAVEGNQFRYAVVEAVADGLRTTELIAEQVDFVAVTEREARLDDVPAGHVRDGRAHEHRREPRVAEVGLAPVPTFHGAIDKIGKSLLGDRNHRRILVSGRHGPHLILVAIDEGAIDQQVARQAAAVQSAIRFRCLRLLR
jgi:hypothetical protein